MALVGFRAGFRVMNAEGGGSDGIRIRLPRATVLAQEWVAGRLHRGAAAVDATAGNGHDSLFLARAVGEEGRVWAFDTQAEALQATRRRLAAAGLEDRVALLHACHSSMARVVSGPVGAVMFNLGYLPGGDKARITCPDTTLAALDAALGLLAPGGLVTVVAYPGHSGGAEEAEAVDRWAMALDGEEYRALTCRALNSRGNPPRLVAVERRRLRPGEDVRLPASPGAAT